MEDQEKCLECEKPITDSQYVKTEQGLFCQSCYDAVLSQIKASVAEQSQNINYLLSGIGATLGGVAGIAVWWAVTFFSGWAVGIIAIVIGITVAKGITLFNGNKRSTGLQIMAALVTVVSYFYADYLVTRSFILKANPEYASVLSFLPNPEVFIGLLQDNFEIFTLVFLAIAVWQAWTMTKPVTLES